MSRSRIDAALPISSVTIYPGSALILRRGTLALPEGETRIDLEGLPGGLAPDSVRVEVEPDQGLLVLDVSAGEESSEPEAGSEGEKLKAEYDALLQQRKRCAARIANSLSELELFLGKENPADTAKKGGFLPVNIGGWKEYFDFLRARLEENREGYRGRVFALLELEKKIAAASANLARLQGPAGREHGITVRVGAPRSADYTLSLSYLQEQVSWYPVYAVAGVPEEKKCSVSLSAVVAQATGEDWRGVEILLSTAVPRFSCSIPRLASRRLREADAVLAVRKAAPAPAMGKDMDRAEAERAPRRMAMEKKNRGAPSSAPQAARLSTAASGPAPQPIVLASPPPAEYRASGESLRNALGRFEDELGRSPDAFRSDPYIDALFQVAGGSVFDTPPELPPEEGGFPGWMDGLVSPLDSLGGYDYRFPVAGKRDVPSSPVPRKLPVARKVLDAEFTYVTVPAARESVYLKVLFANDAENPLPSGPAQVFAGDSLIGSLFFPTLGPGEKGSLSLGAERDIKVLRREKSARRRRGVVAKEVITDFTVEIELISFKDRKAAVEVYDRLPVSRQPREIVVGDFRSSPAARVSERKVLFWSIALEPRKKTVVEFSYSLRHPADFRVTLEEDSVPFQPGREE